MTRTSKRLAARSAARQRQAKANEDQRHRERTELDHATEFEVARLRRDDAAATVVAHERSMARQVETLLALGNSVTRVAELTGETDAEIKRLRKLTDGSVDQNAYPGVGGRAGVSRADRVRPNRSRSAPRRPTAERIRIEQVASSRSAGDAESVPLSDFRDPDRPVEQTSSVAGNP